MKTLYNCIISIFFIFIFWSCTTEDEQLVNALKLSGNNRHNLEEVLIYYENQPQKYEAACFLVKNMPGHFSLSGKYVNDYYEQIDSFLFNMPNAKSYLDSQNAKFVIDSLAKCYPLYEEKIFDIKVISSAFLIKNIDEAFDLWENSPWSRHVDFDEFCEFLLPYRIDNRYVLEDWRGSLREQLDLEIVERLKSFECSSEMKNSAFWACKYLTDHLKQKLKPDYAPNVSPNVYKLSSHARIPYGGCDDNTRVVMGFMRSLGIPVMIDFIYQWPFRSLNHTWNILLANSGKKIPFVGGDTGPDIIHKPEQKMAKVFRRTYAINRDILNLQMAEKIVPPAFRDFFIKDVTEEYMRTYTVKIPIKWKQKQKYAYLAVFNDKEWIPICYGEKKNDSFIFSNIGNNIVYLPVYYGESGLKAFADPFILDTKGNVKFLTANTNEKENLKLDRKYYISEWLYNYVERLRGGILEASNDSNFCNSNCIHTITKWNIIKDSIEVTTSDKYRYWRYLASPDHICNIAELEFFPISDSMIKFKRIIGTGHPELPDRDLDAAFDGDPLTFFEASTVVKQAWVGIDFGIPVAVSKIAYMPRNDDNNIRKGDVYELFYWDKNGWIPLGRKVGEKNILTYNEVPTNALLLLKDLTRGQETRIFTYENDEQQWW